MNSDIFKEEKQLTRFTVYCGDTYYTYISKLNMEELWYVIHRILAVDSFLTISEMSETIDGTIDVVSTNNISKSSIINIKMVELGRY